jgi:hypothetical protein
MPDAYLNQAELAARWRISPRTLERWRWRGTGIAFVKVGNAVRYRLQDVERFEARQLRQIKQDVVLGRWGAS